MIPISLATKSKWLLSNNLSGQPADDVHIMSLCFHLLLILINICIQNLYTSQNKKDIGRRPEYQGSAYNLQSVSTIPDRWHKYLLNINICE